MTNLLHKAYENIDAGNVQSAQDILERLVQVDPSNIEAWEAYMQICETCEELDSLCERILQVPEIIGVNRESIFDYYYFLRRNFKSCDLKFGPQRNVTLELMNQFSFSSINQSLIMDKSNTLDRFQQSFIRLLGKVIFVPYIILLLTGLTLLLTGNNFGYWMLIVLAPGIIISLQKMKVPINDAKHEHRAGQTIFSGKQGDEIRYYSELIR